jgi:hypothetical protein
MNPGYTTTTHALWVTILEIAMIAAHPVAAVYLQSIGIPQPVVNVLLGRIETMRLLLRTGFGELATSYGGTHEEHLAGYGQGNAATGSILQL